jgi:hypothetical protein
MPDNLFLPEKRKFYGYALSVIATDLPSEKSPKLSGTSLANQKRGLDAKNTSLD